MRVHRTGLESVLFGRNKDDATALEDEKEEDGF
jgi:hypothetical protein